MVSAVWNQLGVLELTHNGTRMSAKVEGSITKAVGASRDRGQLDCKTGSF